MSEIVFPVHCLFCGCGQRENGITVIIRCNLAAICNRCVGTCNELIAEHMKAKAEREQAVPTPQPKEPVPPERKD